MEEEEEEGGRKSKKEEEVQKEFFQVEEYPLYIYIYILLTGILLPIACFVLPNTNTHSHACYIALLVYIALCKRRGVVLAQCFLVNLATRFSPRFLQVFFSLLSFCPLFFHSLAYTLCTVWIDFVWSAFSGSQIFFFLKGYMCILWVQIDFFFFF